MNANRATSTGEGLALAAILLLFLALGLAFSWASPPFEKPDELYHYAFARHLAQGQGLPTQTLDNVGLWEHEGAQAPLYYFLLGRLTSGIDQSDFDALNLLNPRANLGNPLYPGNKNLMLYSAQPKPLAGANLALHAGRWLSLSFGLLTLVCVYLTARLAFPRRPAARLFTVLIIAAIPQFAFISSAASNDSLIILVSAATLYWLARLLAMDAAAVTWRDWAALGILLGLAGLSKLQGLVLLAPIGVVVLWIAWRRRSWRLLLTAAAGIGLPAIAIAGWWYWRNFTLYGDWLGAERLLEINGMRSTPLTWAGFWGEMRGLRYSFWGLFGWFNILLPTWFYRFIETVALIAVAGFGARAARAWATDRGSALADPAARVMTLLAFWAITLIAAMVYWATFATSSQGRLLFPALSAFGVILVAGLLTWLDRLPRWRWAVLSVVPAVLIGASIYALASLLPAAYAAPRPVAGLPENARETHIVYDGKVELVGLVLPEGRFRPGDSVPVTLFMRGLDALQVDLQLFIQFLDENQQPIGNVTTHPGWGRNPTSLWQPGALYEDHYLVLIDQLVGDSSPLLATVYVGFSKPDSLEPLPAVGPDGLPSDRMVGSIIAESGARLDVDPLGLAAAQTKFEQGVALIGERHPPALPAATNALSVTLLYEAAQQPADDLTAFVHLTDLAGEFITGYDQPPGLTRFPTSAWKPGDRILSEFTLALPDGLAPGVYQIWSGLYVSASAGEARLAIAESDRLVEHDRVLVGTVTAP